MAAPLHGQGGARQTGGGFGGCVVAIVPDTAVRDVTDAIAREYRTPDNADAEVFVCQASDGAAIIANASKALS